MGKIDCNRLVNGILLVNKPQGLTSHSTLKKAQYLYRAKKAGHTGSLDPLATGMLPICFGEAAKFCQYLLDADKCYQATGLLGIKTTTADAMGEVLAEVREFKVSAAMLEQALSQFQGKIEQIPSMFSALKHKGLPLYKLARQGIEIERAARCVQIHSLQLLDFDGEQFSIKVVCSKGTYIRNLVEDLGEQLGTHAHVTQLHRLYTAGFSEEKMFSLEELEAKAPEELDSCLLAPERAIDYLPKVLLDEAQVIELKQGKVIHFTADPSFHLVRLHHVEFGFVGLGECMAGLLKVKRLLAH